MENKEKNKLTLIKTNVCCFITDCDKTKGYDYSYHRTKITDYLFDGEKAKETYCKNWYMIPKYPEKIEVKESDKRVNSKYELKDKDMESKKLPLVIKDDDFDYDYEDPEYALYKLEYEIEKGGLVEVDVEIELLMEIDGFQLPPNFSYKGLRKDGWSTKEYRISHVNIKHQWLDKMIIPEVLLHQHACKIDSSTLYHLVRSHIKDNINTAVAAITSDYDFCFTVVKRIPLHAPRKFTYTNPFESTKKKRQKLQHGVQKYNENTIFEMTSESSRYQGYTPIKPITAKSEEELKQKIDMFLEDLMVHINRPLINCPHCEGKGYVEEVVKFNMNDWDNGKM